MTIYSFYIFDRHTECIYSKRWSPRVLPPGTLERPGTSPNVGGGGSLGLGGGSSLMGGGGIGSRPATQHATTSNNSTHLAPPPSEPPASRRGLSASDDAKLVFGAVFSLRNMVRRLGGEDDNFISYRTTDYKLHYFETPTRVKFVMLTDTKTNNLRIVLQQIWANLYVPYVVMNPLSPVEHKGGAGVANEAFEFGLESFVTSMFPA